MENLTDIKTENGKTQNGSHSSFIVRSKDNRRCFEKKRIFTWKGSIQTIHSAFPSILQCQIIKWISHPLKLSAHGYNIH